MIRSKISKKLNNWIPTVRLDRPELLKKLSWKEATQFDHLENWQLHHMSFFLMVDDRRLIGKSLTSEYIDSLVICIGFTILWAYMCTKPGLRAQKLESNTRDATVWLRMVNRKRLNELFITLLCRSTNKMLQSNNWPSIKY